MQISVRDQETTHNIQIEQPAGLLQILRESNLAVPAPCGGKGTCLKCTVTIEGIGSLLSCQTILDEALWQRAGVPLDQPLVVRLPRYSRPQIATSGMLPELILSPLVARQSVIVDEPSLKDQRADDERFFDASGLSIPYRLLSQLPDVFRRSKYHPTAYVRIDTREVLRFVTDQTAEPLGLAVDIGTTTLAGYLCDLKTGRLLASDAMLNPQRTYGADVISRIEQAMAGHQTELQRVLAQAIGELAHRLLNQIDQIAAPDDLLNRVAHVVLTGNTVMMHLLTQLPPDAIARTPFIPVSVAAQTRTAAELGLPLEPDTICQLMPSIAAYVGADITAGLIATGLSSQGHQQRQIALLIDIGTNGEMVLSTPNGRIACSTAAGPAFEAANITCGLGGVRGAIDRITVEENDLVWTVIGGETPGETPAGLCGSGLVAAIASFLKAGLIDETGRITDEPELLPESLARRVRTVDGQRLVMITERGLNGEPVFLSQKDIRELQNAKAAIAAGVLLLLEKAGLEPERVDTVYIAGGFGNYLDIEDALAIGLLPPVFRGRTRSAGNTAGMGALACLLQQSWFGDAAETARTVTYFELSAEKRFTDLYIEGMMFPEPPDQD